VELRIQSTARGLPALHTPLIHVLVGRAALSGASLVTRQKYDARSFMSPVRNRGMPVGASWFCRAISMRVASAR